MSSHCCYPLIPLINLVVWVFRNRHIYTMSLLIWAINDTTIIMSHYDTFSHHERSSRFWHLFHPNTRSGSPNINQQYKLHFVIRRQVARRPEDATCIPSGIIRCPMVYMSSWSSCAWYTCHHTKASCISNHMEKNENEKASGRFSPLIRWLPRVRSVKFFPANLIATSKVLGY